MRAVSIVINSNSFHYLIMIEKLLEFLSEDLGGGDITTDSLIPEEAVGEAAISAKETGIVAGVKEATMLLDHFGLTFVCDKLDGQRIVKGERLISIKGDLRSILKVERLALNIISRMSGIATLTNDFSNICKPFGVKVLGTRKTTPGFRAFEKKAIEIGGGKSHRHGLYDEILIKDNHLSAMNINEAVKKARMENPGKKVEVEVSVLEEAVEAINAGAEIIMFDNLSPDDAREQIEKLEGKGLRGVVTIELSGGINRSNLKSYAKAGADRISIGGLTTSSKWLDFSLKIVP
jgi:nicotinate-nucleotide pyrophosphorylase (carboxylating)